MTASYVGIPYVDGGRGFDGCDCWGLVFLYLTTEAGLEIPSYAETPARDLAAVEAAFAGEAAGGTWRAVGRRDLRRFDVVQMWTWETFRGRRVKGRRHVGVMADGRTMLHCEIGTASVAVGLDHPMIRARLIAFWRHRDLIQGHSAFR